VRFVLDDLSCSVGVGTVRAALWAILCCWSTLSRRVRTPECAIETRPQRTRHVFPRLNSYCYFRHDLGALPQRSNRPTANVENAGYIHQTSSALGRPLPLMEVTSGCHGIAHVLRHSRVGVTCLRSTGTMSFSVNDASSSTRDQLDRMLQRSQTPLRTRR